MNASSAACALSGEPVDWRNIDWAEHHRIVRRLQARIVKAVREGCWNKVKTLQWLLTHSLSGKLLAVRRVTENNGRKTPGVDGETWSTPDAKTKAVLSLKRRGYQPRPLRRVLIPKSNGKMRPLGIPTMHDRAMQALHLLALEPVAEATADRSSFGFRPKRSTADAREKCYIALSNKGRAKWILEDDIKGCFDNISHQWLLTNVCTDKVILQAWLKAGFIYKDKLFPTEAGTPQGGIISPTLANITLDGLEALLEAHFKMRRGPASIRQMVNLARYADDFVITGRSKELLVDEVKPLVTEFLKERGLILSPEKTRITHIDEGFDFLGWNIRKYNGKMLIKPSRRNVQAFCDKIREVVKAHRQSKTETLVGVLNPIIKGWATYHRGSAAKRTFTAIDYRIWQMIWRWACRRHPRKSARWVKDKYFQSIKQRNWVFAAKANNRYGETKLYSLARASDTKIVYHTKILGDANPFDPAWESYFDTRMGNMMKDSLAGKKGLLHLWQRQGGSCPRCRQRISTETGWQLHHVIRRVDGGTDETSNLQMLHPTCHRQLHSRSIGAQPAF
jgi:RNA-directed DNA polymerase